MARMGWLGLPLFGFTPRKQTVSCVLSGGGSRASFQLGALAWLYRNDPKFTPTTFVGTSAGAILAAGIAQGSDVDEQRVYAERLREIWLGMNTSEDMFTPRPWLARAKQELPLWRQIVDPPEPPPTQNRPFAARLPFLRRPEPEEPEEALDPPAVDPLELALRPDEEVQAQWSLADLAGVMGQLGNLPRIGSDLATIRLGMEQTRSMYRPGPMLAELLDKEVFDGARVAASGNTLRIAMVSLESGELRYMCEDGRIVDRNDVHVDDLTHNLATGVLASCSIPAVFRPVPLGQETYVDGGVRENLPAELAIGHFRTERNYVISSSSMGVPARQSMAEADLFSIVTRSMEILIDEGSRDEHAYAHSAGAIVIDPEVSVHDAMTVHPGLIRINMDYGWMRAAEEVLDLGATQEARTARITILRMQCLQWEQQISDGDDTATLGARLAGAKNELRRLVEASPAELLPADAEQWWRGFERHPAQPSFAKSWLGE